MTSPSRRISDVNASVDKRLTASGVDLASKIKVNDCSSYLHSQSFYSQNKHSPYQRLRAAIILNILQAVVVGWFLFNLNLLPVYLRGSREFHPSALLPTLPLLIIFGLVGLFRTPLLKHLILRVCLTLEGAMPLRYAGFLNYATTLGICFKRFHTAERTLEGIESVNMMRKRQVKRLSGSDARSQAKFVLNLFQVAA